MRALILGNSIPPWLNYITETHPLQSERPIRPWRSQEPQLALFVLGLHGMDGVFSVFSRYIRAVRAQSVRVQKDDFAKHA